MAEDQFFKFLKVNPCKKLEFTGPLDKRTSARLVLRNKSDLNLIYKIKSTASKSMRASPNGGIIKPSQDVNLEVTLFPFLIPDCRLRLPTSQFKMQIQYAILDDENVDLKAIWANGMKEIVSTYLDCTFNMEPAAANVEPAGNSRELHEDAQDAHPDQDQEDSSSTGSGDADQEERWVSFIEAPGGGWGPDGNVNLRQEEGPGEGIQRLHSRQQEEGGVPQRECYQEAGFSDVIQDPCVNLDAGHPQEEAGNDDEGSNQDLNSSASTEESIFEWEMPKFLYTTNSCRAICLMLMFLVGVIVGAILF